MGNSGWWSFLESSVVGAQRNILSATDKLLCFYFILFFLRPDSRCSFTGTRVRVLYPQYQQISIFCFALFFAFDSVDLLCCCVPCLPPIHRESCEIHIAFLFLAICLFVVYAY